MCSFSDGLSLLNVTFHYLDWQNDISSRCSALRISDCDCPQKVSLAQIKISGGKCVTIMIAQRSPCHHVRTWSKHNATLVAILDLQGAPDYNLRTLPISKISKLEPRHFCENLKEPQRAIQICHLPLQPLSTLQKNILIVNQHSLTL